MDNPRPLKRGLERRYQELVERISHYEWDIAQEDDPNTANTMMIDLSIVKTQLEMCIDKELEAEQELEEMREKNATLKESALEQVVQTKGGDDGSKDTK